jgi:hypothetical protein
LKAAYEMFSSALAKRLCVCLLALTFSTVPGTGSAAGQTRLTFPATPTKGAHAAVEAGDKTVAARDVWPGDEAPTRLSDIGRGKGIVFSPDLSVPTNRSFYERLGFAYFEDASWATVISRIQTYNRLHPADRVEVLVIESHGTNGNGLKLQESHEPRALRSYVSVGALQERLEGSGVRLCVVTACNAGRLFRPRIYRALDTKTRDPLFLPATLGILNASARFNAAMSGVRVVYPAKSDLETVNYGDTGEFDLPTRAVLGLEVGGSTRASTREQEETKFVVSDILIQLLTHDPRLTFKTGGYVGKLSSANFTDGESEDLYRRFLCFVNAVAASEGGAGVKAESKAQR